MYILVFLSVMATAGLIPDMLARGRADFYLSKPLSRARLLLTKVFGIWIVYGCLMVASFMVNYFLSSALNGIFDLRFLYIVIMNLIAFLIWLSVTAFAAILTHSTAISIMAAFLVWIAQWVLQYHDFVKEITDSKVFIYIVDALYYIFPKASELSSLTSSVIFDHVESWLPLYSSLIFAVALMAVTVVIFNRKSY
jgi:ABC-type transport system involved in multi-copper enzyme maturation permease subunit